MDKKYYDGEMYRGMDEWNPKWDPSLTIQQLYEQCLVPNLFDAFRLVGNLIFWCILFRILTQTGSRLIGGVGGMSLRASHLTSIVIGTIVLAQYVKYNMIYPMTLATFAFITLHSIHGALGYYRGAIMAILCVSFNVFCELQLALAQDWHSVRGVQMILSMKCISLGFDMDNAIYHINEKEKGKGESKESISGCTPNLTKVPSFIEFFGYALCPATCIFGPWIKYSDYQKVYDHPRWDVVWGLKIMSTLFLAKSVDWQTLVDLLLLPSSAST